MELLEKLGIDWKLLLAQLFNFAVLLFVLHKFLYRPILKKLEERRQLIESNLAQSKELGEKFALADKAYSEKVAIAERKAQEIFSKTEIEAEKTKSEILEDARAKAVKILEDGKIQAEKERGRIFTELERESGTLVKGAIEKILRSVVGEETAKPLLEKAAKAMQDLDKRSDKILK